MKKAVLRKIVVFGVMNAVIALLLACAGFGVVEFLKIKKEALTQINSQAGILAYNLEPALLFEDKDAADKTLQALHTDPSINSVKLYKANGEEFASFGHIHQSGDIQQIRNILYKDKVIGRLEISSVYVGMRDKVVGYLFVCFLIILISIPASHLISDPIRRQVSQGVLQMEEQSRRLRMLAGQLTNTEQMERKRIAAIIHDHLQQLLVAGKLQLGLAARDLSKEQYDKAFASLNRVDGLLNEATRAAKTLTVELRPPVLYEDGLPAALGWLAKKFKNEHDLDVVLDIENFSEPLPDTLKIMIFESVKELLFNVVKYAKVNKASLFLKHEGEYITVIVEDKGDGFDVEQKEKGSIDKGFGLFSIRERFKLLNGDLKVFSVPGQGTTIELRVPVSSVEETVLEKKTFLNPVKPPQSAEKKVNILLVDDHKIVRQGIAKILKENSLFNVVAQAENGIEALEKAEKFMPDVVIMDINMPKLNGIETTKVIKNKFPQMDVIGLSVQDEDNIYESMKKAGAVTLLNKGGDPQELIQAIMTCKIKRMIV